MKHKHYELLIHAAENADARFVCDDPRWKDDYSLVVVLECPKLNWSIKPADPVYEWQISYKTATGIYALAPQHYRSVADFKAYLDMRRYEYRCGHEECELFEPSKREVE